MGVQIRNEGSAESEWTEVFLHPTVFEPRTSRARQECSQFFMGHTCVHAFVNLYVLTG